MHAIDLPPRLDRILVVGVSGSGKSTLCRDIARLCHMPYTELDSLYHGENWTARESFLDDVRQIAASERWVSEFQYVRRGTTELLAPRADVILWLDYPYRIARARLYRRTLARAIDRRPLWNGNREKPLWKLAMARTKEENILMWQRQTRHSWRDTDIPMLRERYPELPIVRLAHPRHTRQLLATLSAR